MSIKKKVGLGLLLVLALFIISFFPVIDTGSSYNEQQVGNLRVAQQQTKFTSVNGLVSYIHYYQFVPVTKAVDYEYITVQAGSFKIVWGYGLGFPDFQLLYLGKPWGYCFYSETC